MPEKRTATQIIIVAISLVALATIIWRISDVIIIVFGGVVGAATLRALALPLKRLLRVSENWAISITIVLIVGLFAVAVWRFGNQVSNQAGELEKSMLQAWNALIVSLNQNPIGASIIDTIKGSAGKGSALSGMGVATGALLNGVLDAVLLICLAVYLAYDPTEYMDGCLRLFPPGRRGPLRVALIDTGSSLRSWVLAQLIAMVIIGTMVAIGMALLGVPFAFLLGCLAGLLEFVPIVGAVAFTIPGVLLAFAKGPMLAVYALLVYVGVQQIESNVIVPLLQRWAVRIAPGLTLISVVIGGVLFGAMGVIFATPLAVVAMVLTKHLYVENTLEHEKPPLPAGAPRVVATSTSRHRSAQK